MREKNLFWYLKLYARSKLALFFVNKKKKKRRVVKNRFWVFYSSLPGFLACLFLFRFIDELLQVVSRVCLFTVVALRVS